jgi:hypothetical protein
MPAFDSTIPFGEPELIRASSFRRFLPEAANGRARGVLSDELASLSPSLFADLNRTGAGADSSDTLDVLAACVRHSQAVTVHLQFAERALPISVFPQAQLVHCPLPTDSLYEVCDATRECTVIRVEPALINPPADVASDPVLGTGSFARPSFRPLGALLWHLALHGGRAHLLPEIAGPAVYRVNHGLDLSGLRVPGTLLAAVYRLRRDTCALREIAEWPGLGRERAERLLNALYLQSGLIVSRSHPDVTRDTWFGALVR